MASTVHQKRVLKSRLVNALEGKGFKIQATDSADILVFSNKKINAKSKKYSAQKKLTHSYMTSFGEVGAKKLIAKLSK